MSRLDATRTRLQHLWNAERDTPADIRKLRVEHVTTFTRQYWCAVFKASETGRTFIILGGNADQAYRSIKNKTSLGRGTFRDDAPACALVGRGVTI
jgi:hypothetical protein